MTSVAKIRRKLGLCGGPTPPTVGRRVKARHLAGVHGVARTQWYPGVIRKIHTDHKCDIAFDDGDFEARVLPEHIKPMAAEELASGLSKSAPV
eukprot:5541824-Prymnesium_polylepis.2